LSNGGVTAAAFVDAQHCAGIDAVERARLYQGLIAASPLLADLLAGRQCGKVLACDATPGAVADAAPEPGLLRVGEAAFAIDPLSSQGVAAALRSAVQAAACVRTALRRPDDAGACLGLSSCAGAARDALARRGSRAATTRKRPSGTKTRSGPAAPRQSMRQRRHNAPGRDSTIGSHSMPRPAGATSPCSRMAGSARATRFDIRR